MPSLRYLNTILTVIALLLTLNLWTAWTTTPGGQAMSMTHTAEAAINPTAQRHEMVGLLKKLNENVADLKGTLTSGQVLVKLEAEKDNPNDPR